MGVTQSHLLTLDLKTNDKYRVVTDDSGNALQVCPDYPCGYNELWWEEFNHIGNRCSDRDGKHVKSKKNTEFHTCTTVLPEDCPMLAGKVGVVKVEAMDPSKYDGHKIRCYYDFEQVASDCEVADDYSKQQKAALGLQEHDNWFDPAVMDSLCSRRGPVDKCPKNPRGASILDGDGKPICSEMLTCTLCKQWAGSDATKPPWPGSREQTDNIIDEWCKNRYPTDPACKCVNKGNDPIYTTLQKSMPANPGCWWNSCFDKEFQFDMVKSYERSWTACPDAFCANIINVYDDGEIDWSKIDQVVTCTGDKDPKCNPDCVKGNGKCTFDKTGGKAHCVCNPGWKGPSCSEPDSTPVIPCAHDCGAHGVCKDGECVCEDGWKGPTCSDPDTPPVIPCTRDCGAHGVCKDGACVCEDGWSGPNCDIEPTPGGKIDWKKVGIAVAAGAAVLVIAGVAISVAIKKKKPIA